ncbi:hypothetical protein BGZ95_003549 [Linnemannia exigua]|uniref:F-box domain-containing protein n=1 Tax=Linnemannia exigua TaxID=604196 RepID=A0AAD4D4K5_9FUNG|nr:hypothetical protein BGZ95_003549 [Linnemannia exigua]
MPANLAELVGKLNTAVSDAFTTSATTHAEPAATTTTSTDRTVTTTVTTADVGVTSTCVDNPALRRSSRVVRSTQAKTDSDMTEGSKSASAKVETATKKRARDGKATKDVNPARQVQAEDNLTPRKRRKKMTGKDAITAVGQDGDDGLQGHEIADDAGVSSSSKAESAPTPAPKKRGQTPKNATTDTRSTTASTTRTPKKKKRKAITADTKGKGKNKATADPTSLNNMEFQASTGDGGKQDQSDIEKGGPFMTVPSGEQGLNDIQRSSSTPSIFTRAISAPPKIDSQDPFASIPVEILQQILSWLPLPEIARVSLVSKAWLDAVHYLSVWKTICEMAGLGEPKKKYRTHMALACANSFWICSRCHSYTNAKSQRADLPLPVKDVDDNGKFHMLCLECRREYYLKHPEPLKKGAYRSEFSWIPKAGSIAPNGISINYDLSESQLRELETVGTSGHGLPLYNRSEVQRLALRVHGGWVGVDAGAENPRRKRASACAARAKAAKTYTRRPSMTPKMLERSRIAANKREIREEEQERRREEREQELWERRRERARWRRLEYEMRHPDRSWDRRHYL